MLQDVQPRSNLFTLPQLGLDSRVAELVVQLEPLRTKYLTGTTPPWVFFGLKNLFQTVESVTSARIEGNKTTIADFVEAARHDGSQAWNDSIAMIMNVERAIGKIESQDMAQVPIDRDYIFDLHKIAVEGLDPHDEGDDRPGAYRVAPRKITNSTHIPPAPADIRDLMDGLIDLINRPIPHQMELVRTAAVHHRFVWIHPFGNGNGRVVRLLTYAMLAKGGYIDRNGARLLDPAAVFGADKHVYYEKLAEADDLSTGGLTSWCEYMLGGLAGEVTKVDRLLDADFTKQQIIIPAIEYSYEKKRISELERNMLLVCVDKDMVSLADFKHLFPPDVSRVNISQALRRLRDKNLITPEHEKGRRYTLDMNRNPITVGILKRLDENGFLPPLDHLISNATV